MNWKRYLRVELLFNLSLIALSLFFIVTALDYSQRNRAFPLGFGVICLFLSLLYLGLFIKKARSRTEAEVAAYEVNWRPLALFAVLFIYVAGIYYLGLLVASCLFIILFVYFWGRQKLWIALVASGVSFFVIHIVFGNMMRMQLYSGVLKLF